MSTPQDYAKVQNQPFTPNFNKKSNIEENFKILKKYEDGRFGLVTVIEVPENKKRLMMREKTFNNKTELTTEIIAAHKRLGIYDKHLLAFVDYSTGSRSDFCSSVYWIKLYFEFPDHDIGTELRRRTREGLLGFNSSELTHMLYHTIIGGAALHNAELYHGDICPETIEMDNPEYYKLVERFGDLAQPEEFQQTRIMGGGEVYSAPEIYSRIKKGKGKTAIKGTIPAKAMMTADVFNLGMTLVHAGIDEEVQPVYQTDGSINGEALEKIKSKFSKKFPDNNLLVTTVYAMLEQDSNRRPSDFATMKKELPPYEIICQALEQEKQKSQNHLNSNNQFAFGQSNPPSANDAYNQYVGSTKWEQNWTQYGQSPKHNLQGGSSPLVGKLNLPQNNYQNQAPQQQQKPETSAQTNFGVVPLLGSGVPGYHPTSTTIPQSIKYQPLNSNFEIVQPLGQNNFSHPQYSERVTGVPQAGATYVSGSAAVGKQIDQRSPVNKSSSYSSAGLIQPGSTVQGGLSSHPHRQGANTVQASATIGGSQGTKQSHVVGAQAYGQQLGGNAGANYGSR